MKIFITGATGFIGKHLVNKLIEQGNEITINLRKGKQNPFDSDISSYSLGVSDIEVDIQYLTKNKFDGIIHLASLYLTTHKPEDIINLIDSNVQFSTYVLECASQAHINWFINTGTFWQNFQNADYSPVNLYAATKQAFESIAQYYIETKKIKFVTLRLCDTYGPNDTRSKIFNLWERIAYTGETIEMSAGEQVLDISFIDDVIDAFSLLSTHLQNNNSKVTTGAVYAVKAEKRYSLKELAAIYETTTATKLHINWGVKPYREREVMVPWERGELVPEWKAKISLEKGIITKL